MIWGIIIAEIINTFYAIVAIIIVEQALNRTIYTSFEDYDWSWNHVKLLGFMMWIALIFYTPFISAVVWMGSLYLLMICIFGYIVFEDCRSENTNYSVLENV